LHSVHRRTLIFVGQQNGKDATGYVRVGGVRRAPFEQTVVIIDFPEHVFAVKLERTEIVLAIGIVALVEGRILPNRMYGAVDEVVTVCGNAARDDKRVVDDGGTDERALRPERVVERADFQARLVFDEQLLVGVVRCRHGRMVRLVSEAQGGLSARLLLSALIELARSGFHALCFEHDGLGRGFERGNALREAWDVVVHIRIDELAVKARPSQGAAAPALTFQRPAARRGVKTESPRERQPKAGKRRGS
jgi:hypothetical protein